MASDEGGYMGSLDEARRRRDLWLETENERLRARVAALEARLERIILLCDKAAGRAEELEAIEHAAWHLIDDSEYRVDDDELLVDFNRLNALAELLPEECPRATISGEETGSEVPTEEDA